MTIERKEEIVINRFLNLDDSHETRVFHAIDIVFLLHKIFFKNSTIVIDGFKIFFRQLSFFITYLFSDIEKKNNVTGNGKFNCIVFLSYLKT